MQEVKAVRLRVENFLSLRNVSVPLEKLTVLVGPNASGKSNVIKALRVLTTVAKVGPHAVAGVLGINEFREMAFNFDKGRVASVSLEVEMNRASATYEASMGSFMVAERLTLDGHTLFESESTSKKSSARYITKSEKSASLPVAHGVKYFGQDLRYVGLSDVPSDARDELLNLRDFIYGIGTYSFTLSKIRAASNVREKADLREDGSGLARVLLYLYLEKRKAFSQLETTLQGLVPEVEEIIPRLSDDHVYVMLKEKGLREPLPPSLISDGTLRLMAFAAALHMTPSLVAFEEPENCIHPHLLDALTHLFRGSEPQVIITTHSPSLLDRVKPEEVLVVEKEREETKVFPLKGKAELEDVKRLLSEGITLGEAWYSGVFGGVPR